MQPDHSLFLVSTNEPSHTEAIHVPPQWRSSSLRVPEPALNPIAGDPSAMDASEQSRPVRCVVSRAGMGAEVQVYETNFALRG